MVDAAIEAFGGLDVVVNNAGFVRDRMFANAAEDEWDAVVRVHLKGHFAWPATPPPTGATRPKAGEPVDARIINTTPAPASSARVGQAAYSAAKARHRHAHARAGGRARALRRHRQRARAPRRAPG